MCIYVIHNVCVLQCSVQCTPLSHNWHLTCNVLWESPHENSSTSRWSLTCGGCWAVGVWWEQCATLAMNYLFHEGHATRSRPNSVSLHDTISWHDASHHAILHTPLSTAVLTLTTLQHTTTGHQKWLRQTTNCFLVSFFNTHILPWFHANSNLYGTGVICFKAIFIVLETNTALYVVQGKKRQT